MTRAFEPFAKYISYLANGKLDGYFDSIKPEDLVTDLKVQLPSQPMLLHHLGNQPDDERIKRLFRRDLDTVFVFFASFNGECLIQILLCAVIYLLSLVLERPALGLRGSV